MYFHTCIFTSNKARLCLSSLYTMSPSYLRSEGSTEQTIQTLRERREGHLEKEGWAEECSVDGPSERKCGKMWIGSWVLEWIGNLIQSSLLKLLNLPFEHLRPPCRVFRLMFVMVNMTAFHRLYPVFWKLPSFTFQSYCLWVLWNRMSTEKSMEIFMKHEKRD